MPELDKTASPEDERTQSNNNRQVRRDAGALRRIAGEFFATFPHNANDGNAANLDFRDILSLYSKHDMLFGVLLGLDFFLTLDYLIVNFILLKGEEDVALAPAIAPAPFAALPSANTEGANVAAAPAPGLSTASPIMQSTESPKSSNHADQKVVLAIRIYLILHMLLAMVYYFLGFYACETLRLGKKIVFSCFSKSVVWIYSKTKDMIVNQFEFYRSIWREQGGKCRIFIACLISVVCCSPFAQLYLWYSKKSNCVDLSGNGADDNEDKELGNVVDMENNNDDEENTNSSSNNAKKSKNQSGGILSKRTNSVSSKGSNSSKKSLVIPEEIGNSLNDSATDSTAGGSNRNVNGSQDTSTGQNGASNPASNNPTTADAAEQTAATSESTTTSSTAQNNSAPSTANSTSPVTIASRFSYEDQFAYTRRVCFVSALGCVLVLVGEALGKFNVFLFFVRLVVHLYSKLIMTLQETFFGANSEARAEAQRSERRRLREERRRAAGRNGNNGSENTNGEVLVRGFLPTIGFHLHRGLQAVRERMSRTANGSVQTAANGRDNSRELQVAGVAEAL